MAQAVTKSAIYAVLKPSVSKDGSSKGCPSANASIFFQGELNVHRKEQSFPRIRPKRIRSLKINARTNKTQIEQSSNGVPVKLFRGINPMTEEGAGRDGLADLREGMSDADLQALHGLSAARNNRRDKVVEAIKAWNAPLEPHFRAEKYNLMLKDAFAFYRGTSHLYWADFSGDWRMCRFGNPRTRTWLLGDMHIYNFGAYYNNKSTLVYGLNDFDDAVIGDYQYDMWRLAISIVLCAQRNGDLDLAAQERVVAAFARAYLDRVVSYKRTEGGRTFTVENTRGKLRDFLAVVEKSESPAKMLAKWCVADKASGKWVGFNMGLKGKLVECSEGEKAALKQAFPAYYEQQRVGHDGAEGASAPWEILDIAARVSQGLGSIGAKRYYVLALVNDRVVILDVKQQVKPAAFHFMSAAERWEYKRMFANDGLRHAMACSALTAFTDPFNGWLELPGGAAFSVRERSPYKQSFPALKKEARGAFKDLALTSEKRFTSLAEQWGMILATEHAHARHDFDGAMGRFKFRQEVESLTAGEHNRDAFCLLIWQIARDYAGQVEHDHRYFKMDLAPDDLPQHE